MAAARTSPASGSRGPRRWSGTVPVGRRPAGGHVERHLFAGEWRGRLGDGGRDEQEQQRECQSEWSHQRTTFGERWDGPGSPGGGADDYRGFPDHGDVRERQTQAADTRAFREAPCEGMAVTYAGSAIREREITSSSYQV
jgi:hypothetical protein